MEINDLIQDYPGDMDEGLKSRVTFTHKHRLGALESGHKYGHF